MADKEGLTINDTAKRLKVSRNTVYNLAHAGKLRLIKRQFGHTRYYVPVEDIEKLERVREVIGAQIKTGKAAQ